MIEKKRGLGRTLEALLASTQPSKVDDTSKETITAGATAVAANVLKELLIPIPPLPEQKRLVEKLDFIFEKLQKTLQLQKQKLEILTILY